MTRTIRSPFLLSLGLAGALGLGAILREAGPSAALAADAASRPAAPAKAEAAPMPAEATAVCKDGTWSTAKNKQGTCSGHGGVAFWLKGH